MHHRAALGAATARSGRLIAARPDAYLTDPAPVSAKRATAFMSERS